MMFRSFYKNKLYLMALVCMIMLFSMSLVKFSQIQEEIEEEVPIRIDETCFDQVNCKKHFAADFDKTMLSYMKSIVPGYPISNISIGIIHRQELVVLKSYGGNIGDIYPLASISKTYTSTLIFRLIEKGLIRLNDSVNQYLASPLIHPNYRNQTITIEHLLSHRSSLDRDHIRWYDNPPGSEFRYSNTGYRMLGEIISNITALDFTSSMRQMLFDPLDLSESGFIDEDPFCAQIIDGHTGNRKISSKIVLPAYLYPAGGIVSSIHDVSQMLLMHMNKGMYNHYLSNDSIAQISSVISHEEDRNDLYLNSTYGYGWLGYDLEHFRLQGHDGAMRGYSSFMFYLDNMDVGFVALISQDFGLASENYANLKQLLLHICQILENIGLNQNN